MECVVEASGCLGMSHFVNSYNIILFVLNLIMHSLNICRHSPHCVVTTESFSTNSTGDSPSSVLTRFCGMWPVNVFIIPLLV